MDRRTFLATSGATATLATSTPAFAASAQGDAALKSTLAALFDDDVINSPETANSLGLDKGKLAAEGTFAGSWPRAHAALGSGRASSGTRAPELAAHRRASG